MKQMILMILVVGLCGCSALRTTGKVVGGTGKVLWGTAKVTGKVLHTTGKVAYKAGKMTYNGARTVVYMAKGKQIIPLEKKGSSLYTEVTLNRKKNATFLVDTGATSMQISRAMARALRIDLHEHPVIPVTLAGGHVVGARQIILKEVRVRGVRVRNVKALVMEQDNLGLYDGILGMSFLDHFVFSVDSQKPELVLQQRVI